MISVLFFYPGLLLGLVHYINNPGIHTSLVLVNESRTYGNITHLTENDFKEFPQLASVIRDNAQNNLYVTPDGTKVYTIRFTEQEADKFKALYCSDKSSGFFEYNGKYFTYTDPLFVMPSGREM